MRYTGERGLGRHAGVVTPTVILCCDVRHFLSASLLDEFRTDGQVWDVSKLLCVSYICCT